MYTENDLQSIRSQQKKRWLILSIPTVILLGVLIYSLIIRLEWLTSASTILMGAIIIFFYELTIRPLHCYEVHVNNALHGRTREMEGEFASLSEDISVVDGVKYRSVTLIVPGNSIEPEERLYYFDINKPFPDFTPGQMLHVVYHDREVVSICAAQ